VSRAASICIPDGEAGSCLIGRCGTLRGEAKFSDDSHRDGSRPGGNRPDGSRPGGNRPGGNRHQTEGGVPLNKPSAVPPTRSPLGASPSVSPAHDPAAGASAWFPAPDDVSAPARDAGAARRRRLLADGALLLICLIWGSTFVVVKEAVAQVPALTFLALRFALAFAVLAGVFGRDIVAGWRGLAGPGLVTGLFLWGGYSFQTAGLMFTQASRAGFITGLSVVFVPVLTGLVLRESLPWRTAAGVGLALGGLGLLFLSPEAGPAAGNPGAGIVAGAAAEGASALLGDALVLACAVFFALHITALGRYSSTRAASYRAAGALAALQVGVAAAVYLAAAAVQLARGGPAALLPVGPGGGWVLPWPVIGAIVLTGLLATAGAFFVQTAAQRHTPATHTALIFATEPVFAAAFGWLLLGERLGPLPLLGCLGILAGMVIAELPERPKAPSSHLLG
jgi:drug/metabolite transporter (DMT)-like permease